MNKIIFLCASVALLFGCNPEQPTPTPTANNSYVYDNVNTTIAWVGVENVEDVYTIYLAKMAPTSAIAPITIEGLTITIPASALGTNAVIGSAGVRVSLDGTALTGGTINAVISETTLTLDIKKSKVSGIAITANWNGTFTNVEQPDIEKVYVTIGFENAELLTHTGGLYDYFDNILWGKPFATEIEDEEEIMFGSLWYDGLLYTEDVASFGSFYTDYWGMYDMWSGFAITNNFSMTAGNQANQFNVAADGGNKCAIAYIMLGNGAEYERPTIIISEPTTFTSADFTNSTWVYLYSPVYVPEGEELWYTITATGYLNESETGTIDIKLVDNGTAIGNWETISLLELGEVDKIVFSADSNERNGSGPNGMYIPAYFCIDNLKYEVIE